LDHATVGVNVGMGGWLKAWVKNIATFCTYTFFKEGEGWGHQTFLLSLPLTYKDICRLL